MLSDVVAPMKRCIDSIAAWLPTIWIVKKKNILKTFSFNLFSYICLKLILFDHFLLNVFKNNLFLFNYLFNW